jgi:hypothetical protein
MKPIFAMSYVSSLDEITGSGGRRDLYHAEVADGDLIDGLKRPSLKRPSLKWPMS